MIIRVESWTDAVDGGAPRSWRRDFAGEDEDIMMNSTVNQGSIVDVDRYFSTAKQKADYI